MRILFLFIPFFIYIAVEYYGWQAVKTSFSFSNPRLVKWMYWGVTLTLLTLFILYRPLLYKYMPRSVMMYLSVLFVILLFSKIITLLFLFPEDIVRFFRFVISKVSSSPPVANGITRSVFLSRLAMITAAVPAATLIYGVVANAYNYQFRKVKLKFPNLPDAFNGFRIVQLSDIHSGSFTRTEPIVEVIEKINALDADLILFTGDLVNNVADEMDNLISVFGKLKAKHGMFSVMGNHDYGDYVEWNSKEEKLANTEKFRNVHKQLGWDLLLNENRTLELEGEKISIVGVENWGAGGHWSKYGKFDKAFAGVDASAFKILMSHDPSSWDAIVRKDFPHTELTLSGHTHGAQFGIEQKWLKWSPSKYLYKQWAGLYQEGKQFLYVNRGFGFLFYPGRVGILPEVTEITLRKA